MAAIQTMAAVGRLGSCKRLASEMPVLTEATKQTPKRPRSGSQERSGYSVVLGLATELEDAGKNAFRMLKAWDEATSTMVAQVVAASDESSCNTCPADVKEEDIDELSGQFREASYELHQAQARTEAARDALVEAKLQLTLVGSSRDACLDAEKRAHEMINELKRVVKDVAQCQSLGCVRAESNAGEDFECVANTELDTPVLQQLRCRLSDARANITHLQDQTGAKVASLDESQNKLTSEELKRDKVKAAVNALLVRKASLQCQATLLQEDVVTLKAKAEKLLAEEKLRVAQEASARAAASVETEARAEAKQTAVHAAAAEAEAKKAATCAAAVEAEAQAQAETAPAHAAAAAAKTAKEATARAADTAEAAEQAIEEAAASTLEAGAGAQEEAQKEIARVDQASQAAEAEPGHAAATRAAEATSQAQAEKRVTPDDAAADKAESNAMAKKKIATPQAAAAAKVEGQKILVAPVTFAAIESRAKAESNGEVASQEAQAGESSSAGKEVAAEECVTPEKKAQRQAEQGSGKKASEQVGHAPPDALLIARAAKRLIVSSEASQRMVGEYRLLDSEVNGRPSYNKSGSDSSYLFWTPREGGRWVFSASLDGDLPLLARSLQISLTTLPEEVMHTSWTQAAWGSAGARCPPVQILRC
eukprot:TRINITY_DN43290_c0_g1_i1.p1 TRINITY_DN43290_c0_g1~~TRINITY_DN43290_c0_g1_i1.p1  ORF type:complete len:652 (+),score=201.17 TRINITY_DN43290_c0_g1_i1:52-2007(+)